LMSAARKIPCAVITETVKRLFIEANMILGDDVLSAVHQSIQKETSELGREVLVQIFENARIAKEELIPLCQDTGLALIFIDMGQDVHVVDGDFNVAVQEGVRQAYREGFLRKSVCDPLSRMNTGDNTPAVIHLDIVPGDRIRVVAMPKGGGSENMSSVTMLVPAVGTEGVVRHVVEKIREAGPNPCPPFVVGVGIGGSMEGAILAAKKCLLRPVGQGNPDAQLSAMEKDILSRVNALGIGPQGYGGVTTALAVHVSMSPCHIASLPVAVNIQCHVSRHREAFI
jgi:fumarate hydratase subunit alpha